MAVGSGDSVCWEQRACLSRRRREGRKNGETSDELSATRLGAIVPPPWKLNAFSFTPLASPRHWRECCCCCCCCCSSLPLAFIPFRASHPGFRPSLLSPLSPLSLFSHLAIGLPWCFEQRAGTYDAIGYRISAGSLIGRSTAHGRSRSAPVTTDLLRKNVDSFYTLSCPTPDAPHSLHSFLPPSRASALSHRTLRSLSSPAIPLLFSFSFSTTLHPTGLATPSTVLDTPPPPPAASRAIDEPTREKERERDNSSFLSAPCATASSFGRA